MAREGASALSVAQRFFEIFWLARSKKYAEAQVRAALARAGLAFIWPSGGESDAGVALFWRL